MKEHYILFAGGCIPKKSIADIDRGNTVVVGVDAGAGWLLDHGIVSDVMVGDFDSIDAQKLKTLKEQVSMVMAYSPDKNKTDLELALEYVMKQEPKEVVVWGGSGSRLDHTLIALQLLEQFYREGTEIILRDEHNEAVLMTGRRTIKKGEGYTHTSIVPVSEFFLLTLKGFLYDVEALPVVRGFGRTVSNQILAESADIDVQGGLAWVIQSKD